MFLRRSYLLPHPPLFLQLKLTTTSSPSNPFHLDPFDLFSLLPSLTNHLQALHHHPPNQTLHLKIPFFSPSSHHQLPTSPSSTNHRKRGICFASKFYHPTSLLSFSNPIITVELTTVGDSSQLSSALPSRHLGRPRGEGVAVEAEEKKDEGHSEGLPLPLLLPPKLLQQQHIQQGRKRWFKHRLLQHFSSFDDECDARRLQVDRRK